MSKGLAQFAPTSRAAQVHLGGAVSSARRPPRRCLCPSTARGILFLRRELGGPARAADLVAFFPLGRGWVWPRYGPWSVTSCRQPGRSR